ncbi:hypothetical protein ACIGCZ_37210 [Streptomyces nigra]|uniref:hypothetical protein n=1 Tax=Streptomyces nigra TaxID=1827580 RepID=UPI0037CE7F39
MSAHLVVSRPVQEIAAHPETIDAVGLDRLEVRDELFLIKVGIAFGTPLFEDPSLPLGEIHGRPSSGATLMQRPMTIRKSTA